MVTRVDSYRYGAFGDVATSSGETGLRFRYLGEELGASGLYNLRARWLEPGRGRFISRDPIWASSGEHPFGYAQQSPTLWQDPSGLASDFGSLAAFTVATKVATVLRGIQGLRLLAGGIAVGVAYDSLVDVTLYQMEVEHTLAVETGVFAAGLFVPDPSDVKRGVGVLHHTLPKAQSRFSRATRHLARGYNRTSPKGQRVVLEWGSEGQGLKHILQRHVPEFRPLGAALKQKNTQFPAGTTERDLMIIFDDLVARHGDSLSNDWKNYTLSRGRVLRATFRREGNDWILRSMHPVEGSWLGAKELRQLLAVEGFLY